MSKTSGPLTRRRVLQAALATGVATFAPPMLNLGSYRAFGASAPRYSARALKIVERTLVIDMLAPLKIDFTPEAYATPLSEQMAADFRACGITGFHNSIGTGGPTAVEETLQFIAAWQGYAGRNPHVFSLVGTAADLDLAKKERKIAVIMGVQNAEHFREPGDVKKFYQLGQRCAQLTYNSQNLLGSGSTDRVDGGVSDFGEAIINCRALNNHPRLKTDEAIRKLAAKGGVMGITGVRMFVKDKEPTTIEDIVDHIDHVVKLVGVEHVGIGSDSDLNGYDDMPPDHLKMLKESYKASYGFREKIDIEGFDHPRKTFDLTEALIRRGYSDENIGAILGGNFRRLLGATWI